MPEQTYAAFTQTHVLKITVFNITKLEDSISLKGLTSIPATAGNRDLFHTDSPQRTSHDLFFV